MKDTHTDLLRFIEQFQPRKFKFISRGLEIRGAVDLHRAMNEARVVIERLQLPLAVKHSAEMLSYRGFEVNFLKEAS
jgi:hypothetical protein